MKLAEHEVRAIIDARASTAISATQLAEERERALDFYYGRPLGNEIEGRSQVVSRVLMKVVNWAMPSLLRIFATQQSVQFDPVGPEDQQQAKEESGYVRHVLWKKNPGFMIIYSWLKDGLQQKNGYVKYWWDEEERVKYDEFTGLTEDQLVYVMNEFDAIGDVEVLGSEHDENGYYSIRIRYKEKYGCVKVSGAPPDEVIVDQGCRGSIKEAKFVGHLRTDVTRGDLIAQGYDRERVEKLTSYVLANVTGTTTARDTVEQTTTQSDDGSGDWASEELTLLECYTYIDEDDDGMAELRRYLLAGNDELENEEAPEIQWCSWTPIPVPHRHNGQGYYDLVEDNQRIETALTRGVLDNTYFGNNQRLFYDKNVVDVPSLQINRPGGHIAVDGPVAGAYGLVPTRDFTGAYLPIIRHIQEDTETRTGVGRMTMGLDADALAQSTKGAYMDAKGASNQQIEAVARIFAETGYSDLFSSLHRLLQRHQDWPEKFRLDSDWAQVNPTEWQERANLTVSVGLGNASKDEVRQNLVLMGQVQEKLAAIPGLVQPQNAFALGRRAQVELGFENEDFITDPASDEYKAFMAKQGKDKTDPYITGETIKAQTRLQEKAIDSRDKALDRAQERDLTITGSKLSPVLTWPRQESERMSLSAEERVRRATEAAQVLQNPLVREAFQELEAGFVRQARQVDLTDTDGHTRLVMALQMQTAVERHFWKLIQDGHAAGEDVRQSGRRID